MGCAWLQAGAGVSSTRLFSTGADADGNFRLAPLITAMPKATNVNPPPSILIDSKCALDRSESKPHGETNHSKYIGEATVSSLFHGSNPEALPCSSNLFDQVRFTYVLCPRNMWCESKYRVRARPFVKENQPGP